jgi:S-adenosylmethionine:tRNA ribosyltransferase-isomerase
LKTSGFDFYLPEHLIAQNPPEERGLSRLMILDRLTGERTHSNVQKLPQILSLDKFLSPSGEKPLFVFNDTKVRKARLNAKSEKSGSLTEFLLLEQIKTDEWKTLTNRAKRRKPGNKYIFYDSDGLEINRAEITEAQDEFRFLKFDKPINDEFLDKYGSMPLPPYIKRKDNTDDALRYQTIYAKETGSAAAPTAGLHFTSEILDNLTSKGIENVYITLHVGLGTFLPVRCENIEDHVMHEEEFIITEKNALLIESALTKKRRVIAVGTTSLRSLESAVIKEQLNSEEVKLRQGWQKTSIFIYPGYKFKVADALFTNFHTPLSTLLMLVCAFADRQLILKSYEEAVREEYRFFSYGDAMLIG